MYYQFLSYITARRVAYDKKRKEKGAKKQCLSDIPTVNAEFKKLLFCQKIILRYQTSLRKCSMYLQCVMTTVKSLVQVEFPVHALFEPLDP